MICFDNIMRLNYGNMNCLLTQNITVQWYVFEASNPKM